MDPRRLDTMGVLASGVMGLPVPETAEPKDAEEVDADWYDYIGRAAVEEAVEEGKVVKAANYYGIPMIWRDPEGSYRGQLLQYRRITEDETFDSLDAAVDWFEDRAAATYG